MNRPLPILATLALGLTLAGSPVPGLPFAASAAPAHGQVAAARLPNTFDNPPAAARSQAPAQAPSPAALVTVAEAEVADPARVAASEAMLRTTIAAMQAGTPNYGDMTDDLAGKVREQSAAITPLIMGFGALQSLAHVGVENGADLFLVGFDNQITQWIIAMNDEGRIVALLFRPATPPPA